jgi:hypothetical protein
MHVVLGQTLSFFKPFAFNCGSILQREVAPLPLLLLRFLPTLQLLVQSSLL